MKVVAYSIKPFEKEFLAKANQKKHDITLISNPLTSETAVYSEGKDAVIVFTNDDVSANVINQLADYGIKYIATRSVGTDHIDKHAAAARGVKFANVPSYSAQAIAEHTVALALSLSRHLIKSEDHTHHFDFKVDDLIGFNFSGKTVGIIGLGEVGLATPKIFNGLGCKVIGYDLQVPELLINVTPVSLEDLLNQSDIISLHTPLNHGNQHFINKANIGLMKKGIMLLNTARGALIDTIDVLEGLKGGKIGYLGLDAYEYGEGLFFEDQPKDKLKDPLLRELLTYPNVMITPRQAFLTKESLQQIADHTIKNLDHWQQNKGTDSTYTHDKKFDEVHVNLPTQS